MARDRRTPTSATARIPRRPRARLRPMRRRVVPNGNAGRRRGGLRRRCARLEPHGETERLGHIDGTAGMRADAAAAAAAALAFGVSADGVRHGLDGFVPAPHRGQVSVVVDGVVFIDDSKATNVHAALAALDGVDDVVLIAGGMAKGVDLSPLVTRAERIRAVVAIGEAALRSRESSTGCGRCIGRARSRKPSGPPSGSPGRGARVAGPRMRELGPVHRLRRTRRPLRGSRSRPAAGGGGGWRR